MGHQESAVFPGRYQQISQICDFILKGANQAGFKSDELFQITLACDEACTNIIEHAYKNEEGQIWVRWEINNQEFVILLRDTGTPFNPDNIPMPAIPSNTKEFDQLQVGGLGIHLMRKVMDQVHFQFNEHGNKVAMIKRLPNKEGSK